jgi:hypothetical protein
MSVRIWTNGRKEELYNIGLAFGWRKKEKCNVREIIKIVKNVMTLKDKKYGSIIVRNELINTISRN